MSFQSFLKTYQNKEVVAYKNSVTENPLVSICVQTYNHENYIKQCLDSLLMQDTNFTFEILIGEDASTDETRNICIDYAEKYPDKIRLFFHHRDNNIKVHGNPTGRFNSTYNFYSSKGKYIAYCEGDDYWVDSLKLQKQVDFLESNPEYVVCWTDFKVLNQHGHITTNEFGYTNEVIDIGFDNLFRPYSTYTLTVLFKKESFNLDLFSTLDYRKDNTIYALLLREGKGAFLNFVSSVYRIHEGGVYSLKSSSFKDYSSYLNIKEIIEVVPESSTKNMKKVLNSLGNATAFGLLELKQKGEILNDNQLQFMTDYFKNGNFKTKFKYFKRRFLK